jgi:hypothetical protein
MVASILALLNAGTARADAGEMSLELQVDNELAVLHQPKVDYGQKNGTKEYLSRVGARLNIGITNWLDLGLGALAAVPIRTVAHDVSYQTYLNGELYSSYWDLFFPVSASLRWSNSASFTYALQVQAGVVATRWSTTQMLSKPTVFDGAPELLPIETGVTWQVDGFWRAGGFFKWRPADSFAIGAGPYISRTLRAGDWHAGIDLTVSYIFGFGRS